jgi:hypothetical protein
MDDAPLRYLSFMRDTTVEAGRVYYGVLRGFGTSGRLQKALRASNRLRGLLEAGVRHRHPDYDSEQVRLATNRLWLGDELFREVYPGVSIQP